MMKTRAISVTLIGLLLIISGIVTLSSRTWIYDLLISSVFILSPDSPIYESWKKPPISVYTGFYFFNWTNPEDIYDHNIKPRFEQVGPYVFRTDTEKVNITWNANNTVTYRMHQLYYFDEERSNGKLTDRIITLNTVSVSAAHKLRYESYFTKRAFSLSLSLLSPTLHIEKSVSELLYDGYVDPYVDIYNTFPFLAEKNSPDRDKAGFLYTRNNSYTIDGTYNINTGVDGNIGKIMEWNYRKEIQQHNESCAKLGGSIGDFFSQRRTKDYINMFIADICRNFKLDFDEEVQVKGIDGYRYSARHSTLDNGTIVPENKCYCGGECVPSGVINASSCSYGTPTFLSLPHFYGADPYYLEKVEGLTPEKSKHEFFVTLEPRIGSCIDLAIRIQLNFRLHPVEYITLFEDLPTIYFPILWSEQRVAIPEEHASPMRILLSIPNVIVPTFAIILATIGILMIICTNYKFKLKPTQIHINENLKNYEKFLKSEEMKIFNGHKSEKGLLDPC